LNAVLRKLVEGARTVLGENFCGAYLHGSFATGDADAYSDVDFLVVTHKELSRKQRVALQAMHRRVYTMKTPWAQHLEGSYVSKHRLRRVDPSRSLFLYLDNGADRLVWDNHCNTAVVRWLLREHRLTLEGPGPRTLIDPVTASELRREALVRVREYAEWAPEPTEAGPMSRWKQPYLVLTFCRLLQTIEEGRVASKGEAGRWALSSLDEEWADLVQRALDDRPNPWGRVYEPAAPDVIERTLQFADYALTTASRHASEPSPFG
jgi:predicted nucleotidyltransferase